MMRIPLLNGRTFAAEDSRESFTSFWFSIRTAVDDKARNAYVQPFIRKIPPSPERAPSGR